MEVKYLDIDVQQQFFSGESFVSLSFAYRLGERTLSCIVDETCIALVHAMKNKYLQVDNNPFNSNDKILTSYASISLEIKLAIILAMKSEIFRRRPRIWKKQHQISNILE